MQTSARSVTGAAGGAGDLCVRRRKPVHHLADFRRNRLGDPVELFVDVEQPRLEALEHRSQVGRRRPAFHKVPLGPGRPLLAAFLRNRADVVEDAPHAFLDGPAFVGPAANRFRSC